VRLRAECQRPLLWIGRRDHAAAIGFAQAQRSRLQFDHDARRMAVHRRACARLEMRPDHADVRVFVLDFRGRRRDLHDVLRERVAQQ
jgi:hypothetical protein